jgi:lipopolysaccharide assembly protein A
MKGWIIMQILFVFSLILSAIITFFAILNPDVVTIKLFWVNYELSQSMVILVSTSFGAIITIFLGLFSRIKAWKRFES